jgi:hypothetical protein
MKLKFIKPYLQYKAGEVVENNTDDIGLKMALAQGFAERVTTFEPQDGSRFEVSEPTHVEVVATPADTKASKPKERKVSTPKEKK